MDDKVKEVLEAIKRNRKIEKSLLKEKDKHIELLNEKNKLIIESLGEVIEIVESKFNNLSSSDLSKLQKAKKYQLIFE